MKDKLPKILGLILMGGVLGFAFWHFFLKDKSIKVGDKVKPVKDVKLLLYKEKEPKFSEFKKGEVVGTVINLNVPEVDKNKIPTGVLLIFIKGLNGQYYRGNVKDFEKA